MKTLVIAEKPSVAQDIVRAMTPAAGKFEKHDEYFESDDWLVTSAVGHLVEIQAPEEFDVKRGKWSFANLPVLPPYFDLKPMDKTKTRLNAIVKLTKRKDVDKIVNACDELVNGHGRYSRSVTNRPTHITGYAPLRKAFASRRNGCF